MFAKKLFMIVEKEVKKARNSPVSFTYIPHKKKILTYAISVQWEINWTKMFGTVWNVPKM